MKRSLISGLMASSLFVTAVPACAAALDIQPGDYVALRPGDYGVTGFLYERRVEGPYTAGRRTNNAAVEANVAALRITGYGLVAGKTWAWSVTPLWSSARLAEGLMPAAFGREAAGSGDVRLSATLWPLADRERGEYLGFTLAWFEPTGNYSNQRILNIGENRRKLSLVAGWSMPLASALRLELIPELTLYGTNTDYLAGRARKQDATLALTSYLRWHVAPQWELLVGAQANGSGKTHINGIDQNDTARNTRLMLGASHFLDRNTVLSIRYGTDAAVENGFKLKREWLLRIGRRF